MLKPRFLNRSASLALLLLGVLPLSSLIARSFALSVRPWTPLWLALICLCLWAAAFGKKQFLLFTIASAALAGLCVYFISDDLPAEIADMIERVRFVYYQYLIGETTRPPEAELDHTGAMLLFGWLLAAWLSLALHARRARILWVLIVPLPLFIACIGVNGEPSPFAIYTFAMFLLLTIVSGSSFGDDSGRGLLFWQMIVPCTAALLLCLLVSDPVGYRYDEEDVARSRRFDRLSAALSAIVEREPPEPTPRPTPVPTPTPRPRVGSANWPDSRGEMDMSSRPWVSDQAKVLMQVRAETSECLYLRRCSYGDYAGTRWLTDEECAPLSSLGFAAEAAAASFESRELEITFTKRSGDLMLLPYFSAVSGESDCYVTVENTAQSYTVSYISAGSEIYALQLSGEAAERERLYRDYAYEHYTALPETTAFSAGKILEEAGIRAEDPELIAEIAAYVQQSGRYDLNTRPSQSRDLAIYFLTQSHRGYCVHFATAACVLYRAAGVPARIVDGFMVSTKAGERVDVLQADEHAWVEVYYDGLGWVPVEATGSAGFGEGDDGREHLPSPFAPLQEGWGFGSQGPAVNPTPRPTPRPTPAPTPEPTPTPELEGGTETPAPDSSAAPAIPTETPTEPAQPWRLPPWLAIFAVLALLFCLRNLLLLRRKRAVTQKNARKAAVAVWREALRLCPEAEVPDAIRCCAEHAAFGRDGPGKEELRNARRALRDLEWSAYLDRRRRWKLLLRGRLYHV